MRPSTCCIPTLSACRPHQPLHKIYELSQPPTQASPPTPSSSSSSHLSRCLPPSLPSRRVGTVSQYSRYPLAHSLDTGRAAQEGSGGFFLLFFLANTPLMRPFSSDSARNRVGNPAQKRVRATMGRVGVAAALTPLLLLFSFFFFHSSTGDPFLVFPPLSCVCRELLLPLRRCPFLFVSHLLM